MRFLLGLLATSLGAQTSMPVGIVRGSVVAAGAGQLTIRNGQNTVYGCSYDSRTYFERNHWPIAAAALAAGDPVEVLADRKSGSENCYARTVQVVYPSPRAPRLARPQAEGFTLHGDLTAGGIVLYHGARTLTLRTRNGEMTFHLRPDTRFLCDGLRRDPEALTVNTHAFIRGARNLDGDLEAYQVVWGQIMQR
jgi:hypothetical protein